jgi:hypothetical protein
VAGRVQRLRLCRCSPADERHAANAAAGLMPFAAAPLRAEAMLSKAVVALALIESAEAFTAPVARSRSVQMFSEGDIGV